ncbi:MAG: 3-phosphoshikimate 1-carboxyvinyltransferase, partial [Planctomycetota bacterium]
ADSGPRDSRLNGTLASEDTAVMIESLQRIGAGIYSSDGGRRLRVSSLSPRSGSDEPIELDVANSGTTIRFLTAALSALGGDYRLSGVPRMHERPIGDLVDAIAPIVEGSIEAESEGGCPPVRICSSGWSGDSIEVAGTVSSQYLSGLMMAAPLAGHDIEIRVQGELVSRPYVAMTADVMESFGASVDCEWSDGDKDDRFLISESYQATDYAIEPDASAASYFWAAAAITGGDVKVVGLTSDAVQGDVEFVDILEQMGCTVTDERDGIRVAGRASNGGDFDMNGISDTVQTLSVVAMFAGSPTRIRGVAHNRFKETDRIGDLARECRRLGADVDEHEDGLTIHPLSDETVEAYQSGERTTRVETYDDHRMAMSLALAGLVLPGIRLVNPACTAKTYPHFWADLEVLTGRSHRWTSNP